MQIDLYSLEIELQPENYSLNFYVAFILAQLRGWNYLVQQSPLPNRYSEVDGSRNWMDTQR